MNGARCSYGHELEIVSEGYGLCCDEADDLKGQRFSYWHAWRFTPPLSGTHRWSVSWIQGKNGSHIPAWVTYVFDTKEEAIDFITLDAESYRSNPREFDEERERARLMAV